ncbi:hypothetical protein QCA50_016112 [Cerrena zonata]|uniref:Protein kinase domain-containing protein n=1 Tax=Cerrena zonata TaxID=2478898 RepID=A0AAW0FI92_9APHY
MLAFFPTVNMEGLVRRATLSASGEETFLAVRDQSAVDCMDEIVKNLDALKLLPSSAVCNDRFILRRLLLKLSKASERFPSSLYFTNIRYPGSYPVSGGASADIYLATTESGARVALKKLRAFQTRSDEWRSNQQSLRREALVWKQLDHFAILPFLGINDDVFSPHTCMVSPWMDRGNIIAHISHER